MGLLIACDVCTTYLTQPLKSQFETDLGSKKLCVDNERSLFEPIIRLISMAILRFIVDSRI